MTRSRHRATVLRRVVAAAVAATSLAAPAPALGHSEDVSDRRDVAGKLDIASARLTHADGLLTWTVGTHAPFGPTDFSHIKGGFSVFIWTRGRSRMTPPEYELSARTSSGRIYANVGRPMRRPTSVRASRPDARSIRFTLRASLLGAPSSIRWHARSVYSNSTTCPLRHQGHGPPRYRCTDDAPRPGRLLAHALR